MAINNFNVGVGTTSQLTLHKYATSGYIQKSIQTSLNAIIKRVI